MLIKKSRPGKKEFRSRRKGMGHENRRELLCQGKGPAEVGRRREEKGGVNMSKIQQYE